MADQDAHIILDKELRRDIDAIIQRLREATGQGKPHDPKFRGSRERSLAITKLQEAVMWLGMDLKAINEENPGAVENPYPHSKDPSTTKIDPDRGRIEAVSDPIKVGDTVRATKWITRRDNKCALPLGRTATAIRVSDYDGYQIVDIRLENGWQMIDIVCKNGIPLVKEQVAGLEPATASLENSRSTD